MGVSLNYLQFIRDSAIDWNIFVEMNLFHKLSVDQVTRSVFPVMIRFYCSF